MVDLTANSLLLENEAELADESSAISDILNHVKTLLPEFMTATLQGSGPYQIHIVCECPVGCTMGVLEVSELTRSNIATNVAAIVAKTFNNCNNDHPKGYSL